MTQESMITINFTKDQFNAMAEQLYSILEVEKIDCDCEEGRRLRTIVEALGEHYVTYHQKKQQESGDRIWSEFRKVMEAI